MNETTRRERQSKGLLQERLLQFGVRIIGVVRALPKDDVGGHIRLQVLRSGTSAGANYEEGVASESKRDFIHKLQIALKELRETRYWLRLISTAELLPQSKMSSSLQECDELIAMMTSSINTLRSGKRRDK